MLARRFFGCLCCFSPGLIVSVLAFVCVYSLPFSRLSGRKIWRIPKLNVFGIVNEQKIEIAWCDKIHSLIHTKRKNVCWTIHGIISVRGAVAMWSRCRILDWLSIRVHCPKVSARTSKGAFVFCTVWRTSSIAQYRYAYWNSISGRRRRNNSFKMLVYEPTFRASCARANLTE